MPHGLYARCQRDRHYTLKARQDMAVLEGGLKLIGDHYRVRRQIRYYSEAAIQFPGSDTLIPSTRDRIPQHTRHTR